MTGIWKALPFGEKKEADTLETDYIKVKIIYQKLQQAEKEKRTIYISGAVGFGKTAAVSYFYRRKSYLTFSGKAWFVHSVKSTRDCYALHSKSFSHRSVKSFPQEGKTYEMETGSNSKEAAEAISVSISGASDKGSS